MANCMIATVALAAVMGLSLPPMIASADNSMSLPRLRSTGKHHGLENVRYKKGRKLDERKFQTPPGFTKYGEADVTMEITSVEDDGETNEKTGEAQGDGEDSMFERLSSLETIFVNDKSKGSAWLLNIPSMKAIVVETPFPGGNHESALSNDMTTIAVPHYETAEEEGVGEGGGTPGSEVSLIDVDTGLSKVLVGAPNPFGAPKPHGAAWTNEGTLVATAQLSNGLVVWNSSDPLGAGSKAFNLSKDCNTPHLVETIPGSSLVATGCRCTNPGDDPDCPGRLGILDLETGETASLEAPLGAEGMTVTPSGEIWVGGLRGNEVAIYGVNSTNTTQQSRRITVNDIERLDTKSVPSPIRLAYDETTNTVGVVSLGPTDSAVLEQLNDTVPNMYIFDAGSGDRNLLKETVLSSKRGRINSEGLHAANGFFITGGFDTATMVFVDAQTGEVAATIYFPYCTLPSGSFSVPTELPSTADAQELNMVGANNWSGGFCPRTLRNPFDIRFLVLDGFNQIPVRPSWAK